MLFGSDDKGCISLLCGTPFMCTDRTSVSILISFAINKLTHQSLGTPTMPPPNNNDETIYNSFIEELHCT